MLDNEGFRPNVGIILCNHQSQVFWARRIREIEAWQFPQGGMTAGESPEQAMYRELLEEVGLKEQHVTILAQTKNWLRYRLPNQFRRLSSDNVCIGQKQKWFLVRFDAEDSQINLNMFDSPEFNQWRWVNYWYPINQIIYFKQTVYRRALMQLAHALPVPTH